MRGVAALALGIWALAGVARADEVVPPTNVRAEPSTPASAELSSRSATASMTGNSQYAVTLADRAIRADPKDPWGYYNKGMALAATGETDAAVAALVAAEQHFAPTDRWGHSVAIFGRAHTLAMAGRCTDAKQAYDEYASLLHDDGNAAEAARRYSSDCFASRPPASAQQPPSATPSPSK
jgi:tetratricopeptide (TPR) repeat protein